MPDPVPARICPRMAILPILCIPDPVLRQTSIPVAAITPEISQLIADMFETMYDAPGIGLAAVQVGHPIRLLVIDLYEPVEEAAEGEAAEPAEPVKDPRVFINPEILSVSDTLIPYNEGCLSIPDQYAEVLRPDRVTARWRDETGTTREGEIDGLLAVCLQHEIDHLNGVLFIDHLSRLKRDILLKKVAKAKKG